jgi:hypothetical protein
MMQPTKRSRTMKEIVDLNHARCLRWHPPHGLDAWTPSVGTLPSWARLANSATR